MERDSIWLIFGDQCPVHCWIGVRVSGQTLHELLFADRMLPVHTILSLGACRCERAPSEAL